MCSTRAAGSAVAVVQSGSRRVFRMEVRAWLSPNTSRKSGRPVPARAGRQRHCAQFDHLSHVEPSGWRCVDRDVAVRPRNGLHQVTVSRDRLCWRVTGGPQAPVDPPRTVSRPAGAGVGFSLVLGQTVVGKAAPSQHLREGVIRRGACLRSSAYGSRCTGRDRDTEIARL